MRRFFSPLALYAECVLGASTYSYQSFSALEVLGATKMVQMSDNIRDHKHGLDSVEPLLHRIQFQQIGLTDTTTITWNQNSGQHATVTVSAGAAGTRAFAAPTNLLSGSRSSLLVSHTTSGGNALTWASAYQWPQDVSPITSIVSGDKDLFEFYCPNGATLLGSHLKGYRF